MTTFEGENLKGENNMPNKLNFLLKIFILLAGLSLFGISYFLFDKTNKLSSDLKDLKEDGRTRFSLGDKELVECGPECRKAVEEIVSSVVKITPTPTVTTKESSITSSATAKTQIVYIPLSGPVTTTSINWIDVPGTDTYIDLVNEYGKNATVSWDTFLKVAHGNGQAFARLFDVTNGISVNASEVTTINNVNTQQVSSENLNLWGGRNLYRVQIKSLNSFEVTFASGRIKISY